MLVLSVDVYNAGPVELVMIVPLTSKTAKSRNIPAHIPLNPPEGGLKTPSMILGDQLRAISKDRLVGSCWGSVSSTVLAKVEDAARILLGL